MQRVYENPIRFLTSVEEASHAVVDVVNGIAVWKVAVYLNNPFYLGACHSVRPRSADPGMTMAHDIASAAGRWGMRLYDYDGPRKIEASVDQNAVEKIEKFYNSIDLDFKIERDTPKSDEVQIGESSTVQGYVSPESRAAYKIEISEKAIKCLDQNWRAVLELADELYESLEICGERVGEIVAECAKLPPLPQSDLPSMKWLAEDNRRRGMNLKYEDVFGSST